MRTFALLASISWLATACATSSGPVYAPESLRSELGRRLPGVPANELVVPFEVPEDTVSLARQYVGAVRSDKERVRALVEFVSSEKGLGLSYRWAVNNSAKATLGDKGGNCLGLSSLLVGLSRSLGLRAFYLDATRDPERREEASLKVAAGHIAVVVLTKDGPLFIDFTGELPRGWRYRRMSDLQATAHYYNNLGYEIIHRSTVDGTDVPWTQVQRQFARATRIAPSLATAWNNVGVAASRLGRADQAERSYRRASRLDPDLESPRENLEVLRSSARAEPSFAHADSGSSPAANLQQPIQARIAEASEISVEDAPTPRTAPEGEPAASGAPLPR